MDADTILALLDESSRHQAFTLCLKKLENAPRLDLEALRVCIKLRPFRASAGQGTTLIEQLCDLLLSRIPREHLESDHFYTLASILCSDGSFAASFFNGNLCPALDALLPRLSIQAHRDADRSDEAEASLREAISSATAYLTLLKCSYWLPSEQNHIIGPDSLQFLSQFLGSPSIDSVIHDVISAFLSLLKRREPIVVATTDKFTQPWLTLDHALGQAVLSAPIVDGSLWDQLSILDMKSHASGQTSSKAFRTWFQWISQAVEDKIRLECLNSSSYWHKLQTGLLHGHADQRKYCIAIVRQSLLAAQDDIDTPTMRFNVGKRDEHLRAYNQYSVLFETIVLDRYANQVMACLPELTKVMCSDITPSMVSTLLSAALSPLVQDGVRKPVGNWYIDYVTKVRGDISGHAQFLLRGFLQWATLGDLFTSTLVTTRNTTVSIHGASLADVIARFVLDSADAVQSSESAGAKPSDGSSVIYSRRQVVIGVVDFILDARGKIFQFAILYLLEGLVNGLRACSDGAPLQAPFKEHEANKISRISRLPGLPEIAGDLYKQYCAQLCELTNPGWTDIDAHAYQQIHCEFRKLSISTEPKPEMKEFESSSGNLSPLQALQKRLEESRHRCIQGDEFSPMCQGLIRVLDTIEPASTGVVDLYVVLEAFWEEADRRQFVRSVAIHVSNILFHPTCVRVCIKQHRHTEGAQLEYSLRNLLTRAIDRLQRLSEGRIYILSTLATSLRKACLTRPEIMEILPIDDLILRFVNSPPTIKTEFLFEVAAAEKLQKYQPQRTYHSYYGSREWHAYAAMIDLIQSIPLAQVSVAKRVLDRLLEPWKLQRPGIPIIGKWKNVLQLQVMLILVEFCVPDVQAENYLTAFKHALTLEGWPRHRFLLEWIIARIYFRFPGRFSSILDDLVGSDEGTSSHTASLMKLAVLVAPHEPEDFSTTFMTQLVPFAASPKVQIRHESNYAIPIIFDLAVSKGWTRITENPAFVRLDAFIRSLDKFQSTPWTIRTLKLDAVNDFTLVNIFQGEYLTIESPERLRVAYEDFVALREADDASGLNIPPGRIPLGNPPAAGLIIQAPTPEVTQLATNASCAPPAFFQTKSGFDLSSLYPHSGPPSVQNQRPASVILVASLIDNPTNLGGLSRISESFGLEALYIDDLRQTAHKDFKATSVTSEKHFPIRELKHSDVPEFLLDMKRSGYEVVGIEQTDQSGTLGTEDDNANKLGILPKKCVLVLGSEKGGINAEVLAAVDRCVEIRTVGVTRSLNVQTAGGIALYEWWRKWWRKD
ncbi:hypothetical protein BDU57DRAFT_488990 [Ampelomyces quisqualis]|uniref:tRNA/rRNA methyltransferase SpoU type domain-containing protein n=1 Tax=Ampelomyces quisqualis TaxID=50730 RepID=A0A6A5R1Q0_AMPQU|nr:hypothetical protein BDU57DRAFT_488990 [Ampelomyces quisqualis]